MDELAYDIIRERLAAALKRDSALHKQKRYEQLGAGFLELQSVLRHGGDHRYEKLICAIKFWDAWILARNTDWLEHDHIPEDTWGSLGEGVAADLEADRDIRDSRVRSAFDLTATLEIPKKYGPDREASPLDDV